MLPVCCLGEDEKAVPTKLIGKASQEIAPIGQLGATVLRRLYGHYCAHDTTCMLWYPSRALFDR